MPAMMNTGYCRFWIFCALGPAGCHVSWGASRAQPATDAASTANNANRARLVTASTVAVEVFERIFVRE
jgi:hypothetical protein